MSDSVEEKEVTPFRAEDQFIPSSLSKESHDYKVSPNQKKDLHLSKSFIEITPNTKSTSTQGRDTSESKSRSDTKADIEYKTTLAMIDNLEKQNSEDFKNELETLKTLIKEEDLMNTKFLELIQQNQDNMPNIIEAVFFESSVRNKELMKIVEGLLMLQSQSFEMFKNLRQTAQKLFEENQKLKGVNEIKSLRHAGKFKKFKNEPEESDMYDWVVDINLLTDVCKEGWKVEFSSHFNTLNKDYVSPNREKGKKRPLTIPSVHDEIKGSKWEGAIVSVVGLYDKGKTFVLNNITNSNLPSGKKVNTKGLSFKTVSVDSGTNLVLLDTAGSYSPVKVINELSVMEKEATEMFLLDIVFELSDYFICVVNDFTSLDQRYLDRLSRNLQNSPTKTFREVIVVHNLKEVESEEVLDHLWQNQVTHIYGSGSIKKTKVAAVDPVTGILDEKQVVWFKTDYSRHIVLCNDDSALGAAINPWAFSLLKYWLKAVFVPVNRTFSVIDSVIHQASAKLASYFRSNISLCLEDSAEPLIKYIKTTAPLNDVLKRIPQISIDSTGIVMTRPDSFIPQVDLVQGDNYHIIIDVPGLEKEDITIARQNAITIVKGNRKKPEDLEEANFEKNERKYGEFTMTFKIPDVYERKWSGFKVEKGVLDLCYLRDSNDDETSKRESLIKLDRAE